MIEWEETCLLNLPPELGFPMQCTTKRALYVEGIGHHEPATEEDVVKALKAMSLKQRVLVMAAMGWRQEKWVPPTIDFGPR